MSIKYCLLAVHAQIKGCKRSWSWTNEGITLICVRILVQSLRYIFITMLDVIIGGRVGKKYNVKLTFCVVNLAWTAHLTGSRNSPGGIRLKGHFNLHRYRKTNCRQYTSSILEPRWKRTGSYEFGAVIVNASQYVSDWVS